MPSGRDLPNYGINDFEGDSSFIAIDPALIDKVNRYKPVKRRRWFLQFMLSSALLIAIGATITNLLEKGWSHVRAFAYRVLPEPIIEEVTRKPVTATPPAADPTYKVQRVKLKNEDKYSSYLASLSLKNISPEDVIRPHRNELGGVCNELPPERYWKRMKTTLEVADALVTELGVPLKMINSAYRSPKYNAACPGAASNSYHTRNMALDLMFACSPKEAARAAKKLRDKGIFKGGIGVYSTFIHIDTRGKNANWGIPV
ncbi:MAG: D-Ala-D-Ala carboxypeptidase family metallohydrolase [Verrucomicrobiales bacterium]|nr:D-Ala-D-Ala carboxypeptidase family metallohydrolase [Verrucomicrobiales bacterium]